MGSRGPARFPWLSLVVLVAFPAAAFALPAEEHFRERSATSWTTANGLPQNSINDLLQTPDGALWIATFGGLLRFDGLRFQPISTDGGQVGAPIRATALADDEGGGFWCLGQSGELIHVIAGRIVEHVEPPSRENDAIGLACHAGVLLVHYVSGNLWRRAGTTWEELVPAGSNSGTYGNLVSVADGFLTTRGPRELAHCGTNGVLRVLLETHSTIRSIARDGATTWIGLGDGLARIREDRLESVELDHPSARSVQAVVPDGAGGVWLGTPQGAFHARVGENGDRRLVRSLFPELETQTFNVRAVHLDREGNLWLGSYADGLVRLAPNRVQLFLAGRDRSVTALAARGASEVTIALACQGIFRLRDLGNGFESVPCDDLRGRGGCVTAMASGADDTLWIGVGNRVLCVRGEVRQALAEDPARPREVLALAASGHDAVWVARKGRSLARIESGNRVAEDLVLEREPISLLSDADGSLWIGAGGALARLQSGVVTWYDASAGIPPCDLRDLLRDPDGGLWIATYGCGLLYFDGSRARAIGASEGLFDETLSHVELDDQGRLWLLGNHGLLVVERRACLDVAAGRAARIDPVLLGPERGVPEGNHGSPAGLRDASGRLWFGTIAGALSLQPREFPFNREPPTVAIDSLRVDEGEPARERPAALGPLPERVVFEYTAFALTAPERLHFRYRLQGYDEDWVEAGVERRAAYTRLAPGDYAFEVLARNEDGVWSTQPARLEFKVHPAWWQTVLFRVALVLATGGLLFAAHRARIQILERRARVLLQATEGRVRAEADASRLRDELAHVARVATAGELATSLAHEVNQPLATIVNSAGAARRALARDEIERAKVDGLLRDIVAEGQRTAHIIRRLRAFLKKHASEREPLDLNDVVRETLPLVQRELVDNTVALELELLSDLPRTTADRVQVQQVLVNLLHNACEALSDWQGRRSILVRTGRTEDRVCLEVADTGPGAAPEVAEKLFDPYVTTKRSGMGLGLAICRSIVEAHGGRLSYRREPEGRTTFRVDLPFAA